MIRELPVRALGRAVKEWQMRSFAGLAGRTKAEAPRIELKYGDSGLRFVVPSGTIGELIRQPQSLHLDSWELAAYLQQLEEEEFASLGPEGLSATWASLYRLRGLSQHATSLPLLGLPRLFEGRPGLSSAGALDDANFSVYLDGWYEDTGNRVHAQVERRGAVVRVGCEDYLLSEAAWLLLEAVQAYARLTAAERTRERNFREWGSIRRLALQAGARLDHFLDRTVVLTPQTLRLQLQRTDVCDTPVIEIRPGFADAPETWLDVFDQGESVLTRYDLNLPQGGIVHIVVEPTVRQVLEVIKGMPGRRVAGAKAQAFLHNPYALLGEEVASVLPPEEFEAARSGAGLDTIEAPAAILPKPRPLITERSVYDIAGYAPRVQGIGAAQRVYSPYIVRTGEATHWLPDKVEVGVSFALPGSNQTLLLPFTKEDQQAFAKLLSDAERSVRTEIEWPGLPTPIDIVEAKALKADIDRALEDVAAGKWQEAAPGSADESDKGRAPVPILLIPHNIETVGYSEERRSVLAENQQPLEKPHSLQADLLDHQKQGVQWLQHLWRCSPTHARGALLADDMGLGKTLQLLTLLAGVFARAPASPPALVVAPVTLLDNWTREISRFFRPGTFRVLTLYGQGLKNLRARPDEIDQPLRQLGLTRFLRPGWRADCQLVLTTYETLRDYEFSLARELWSVLICDEAQKIKSPAALVTQAAKAMNAQFKIASTGTPVENSLTDLWCLFDFVQPGLLGALNEFGRKYKRPIEAKTVREEQALEELNKLFAPQVLRRTKCEVASLPAKIEDRNCRDLRLSPLQRRLYAAALSAHRQKIKACDKQKVGQAMLGMLQHLRLLCAHPVWPGQTVDTTQPMSQALVDSPKLSWLMGVLEGIRRKGEKVIIFTELREIQRVVQHYIGEQFGQRPVVINGSSETRPEKDQSRQRLIDQFQAEEGFGVIILSTQAVGFGLNIQKANHVIHYTRCWNPAKEDQATDRVYRIGQAKKVTVYYPTVRAEDYVTFEERLGELLTRKRDLAAKTWLNGAEDIDLNQLAELKADGSGLDFLAKILGEEEIRTIQGYELESLCALLWGKQGFHTYQTPLSGDGGVDVVGLRGHDGVLIQCKASSNQCQALGWGAIKDVSAGAKAYMAKHEAVRFTRIAVTNQRFNKSAKIQAALLGVRLIERQDLLALLDAHPVTVGELASSGLQ
jgi:hypothetical protein